MINIRTIKKLKDDDGLTLKNGKPICYKSGWQVATHGEMVNTPEAVMRIIKAFGGSCGIWYSGGVYYVDYSFRTNTKREAVSIGKTHGQLSILGWKKMNLVYIQ